MNGPKRMFPALPRSIIEDVRWDVILHGEWKDKQEEIYLKESRSSIYTLSKALRLQSLDNHRILVVCDNQTAVHVFNTGRSSRLALNRLCRKALSLVLLHNIRPRWRYLGSARNPTDLGTRPTTGSHVRGPVPPLCCGVWASDTPGGVGPVAGECPPGLCRCVSS